MESIYSIDPDLVTEAIRLRAMTALTAYTNGVPVKWFDAEIAVYLTFLFGEINKGTLIYRSLIAVDPNQL